MAKNRDLFLSIAKIGEKLVNQHLIRSNKLRPDSRMVRFNRGTIEDDPIVKKIKFTENNQLWINDRNYFEGIPKTVYDYHIGSYGVCQKWLKKYKGFPLDTQSISKFIEIVLAIKQTLQMMKNLDKLIETHGGWMTAFTMIS
jgi:hypothetical protein